MKDFTSLTEQPISQIKVSIKSEKASLEKFSHTPTKISKWRIGRRNFP